MNLIDLFGSIARLTKSFNLAEERIQRLESDLRIEKEERKELSKQVGELSTRVAVLEEGRKTTAAEVKAAVTETLSRLEIAWLREDTKRQIADACRPEDAA